MTVYWNGNTYDNQRAAAVAEHVTQPTICYRVKRGYTCDDELDTTGKYWWNGKPYKSIAEISRQVNGMTRSKAYYRISVCGYECDCDVAARQRVECEHKQKIR